MYHVLDCQYWVFVSQTTKLGYSACMIQMTRPLP